MATLRRPRCAERLGPQGTALAELADDYPGFYFEDTGGIDHYFFSAAGDNELDTTS